MTSFQQITSDLPMVEQSDDIMEDSLYGERQNLAEDDIDVEFEFNDDAAQDEQMVETASYLEDHPAQIGDAVPDRDDEMADEEQEYAVEDQELYDAPSQVDDTVVEASATEVLMTEQPDTAPSEAVNDVLIDDMVDFDHEDEDQEQNEKPSEKVQEARPAQPEDRNHNLAGSNVFPTGATREADAEAELTIPVPETQISENLTQYHADATTSSGLTSHDDMHQATARRGSDGLDENDAFHPGTTAEADSKDEDTKPMEFPDVEHTGLEGEYLWEVTRDVSEMKEQPLPHEKPAELPPSSTKTPSKSIASDNNAQKPGAVSKGKSTGEDRQEQSALDDSSDKESSDELHIIVEYNGQELSLFMPRSDEATDMYLLSDTSLMEQDLRSLLSACRPVLSTDLPEDEELVVHFPSLGLEISESAEEATTTGLAQLRDMYIHLSHNDGIEMPDPLHVELFTKRKVSAQLQMLQTFIEEGKGLKGISEELASNQEDSEVLGASNELGESNSNGAIPNVAVAENDLHGSAQVDTGDGPVVPNLEVSDTHRRDETPMPEHHVGLDDPLDFRSPLRQTNEPHDGTQVGQYSEKDTTSHEAIVSSRDRATSFSEETNPSANDPERGQADIDRLFPEDPALIGNDSLGQGGNFGLDQPETLFQAGVEFSATANEAVAHGISTRSSTLLEGEDDFSTNDQAENTGDTNNNSMRKPVNHEVYEPAFPHEEDGFDFGDFVQDTDDLPTAEDTTTTDYISATHDVPNTDLHEDLRSAFSGDALIDENGPSMPPKTDNTSGSGKVNDSSALQTELTPDKDEIDFSDDDDDEPGEIQEPAAPVQSLSEQDVSPKAQLSSTKRSRPYDEDADTPEASPSGLKKQRSN